MTAKEELEKTLKGLDEECDFELAPYISTIAQGILDKLPELGYVRLEDVEFDEERIEKLIIASAFNLEYGYSTRRTDTRGVGKLIKKLAHAIASAKPIRVKEGK